MKNSGYLIFVEPRSGLFGLLGSCSSSPSEDSRLGGLFIRESGCSLWIVMDTTEFCSSTDVFVGSWFLSMLESFKSYIFLFFRKFIVD